jgi:mannose-1-phosphate guanylyltransferase/mannose-6-phosphate isomerase
LSRNGFPKQFLVLHGNQSLFQLAVQRLAGLSGEGFEALSPLIVTNEDHRFLAQEQLREIEGVSDSRLLLEPEGRNTAPAITLAALTAVADGLDPVMVVSPADQMVTDSSAFTAGLQSAIRCAQRGSMVVLGVPPTTPETGYGYIKRGSVSGDHGQYEVEAFTEKPDLETARAYLADGGYFWNGGLFVVKASVWLDLLERFEPNVLSAVKQAWEGGKADGQFVRPDAELFRSSPSISADYAVIEKCPGSGVPIEVLELNAGWSDLGAWDAVWQVGEKDGNGNVTHGDAIAIESKNSLVHANYRLVGVVGVEDVVVVETADAVLVGHKDRAQLVKSIVQSLSSEEREEHQLHRKVHRPWGWYDSIDEGPNFKVKRIMVKPGASLSLQKHHHRAEHWIVVKGRGEVTCDGEVRVLGPNESTFIPLGSIHRLANRETEPLEIIEVQSGGYLGEDDIVRFEDTYGRVGVPVTG